MAATWADPTTTWADTGWSWTGAEIIVPDVNATSTPTVAGFATSTITAAAAGVTEADIAREVTDQRRQQLTDSLATWRANLEIHQSFLDKPEMWGGVDLSGAPLNAEEQAVHVKALTAAIEAAEAELSK